MSLNLKPVLNAQTDNEKLDVVNYNFDQIVNNGGGPRGYQGATGAQGLAGLTGAQGSQGTTGPTGVQGFQGAAAIDLWKTNTSPASNTLVPKHGVQTNPPTVMYGVDKLDPLYTSVFDEAAVLLNRKSTAYGYNLELTDDGVTAADGNKIIYSLANVGSVSTFQMGFYNTTSGNPTEWELYSDTFDFSDGVYPKTSPLLSSQAPIASSDASISDGMNCAILGLTPRDASASFKIRSFWDLVRSPIVVSNSLFRFCSALRALRSFLTRSVSASNDSKSLSSSSSHMLSRLSLIAIFSLY